MLDFNSGWVRKMFMGEAHFDTAHVVEPDACFVQ
jgi:hypothetical protein